MLLILLLQCNCVELGDLQPLSHVTASQCVRAASNVMNGGTTAAVVFCVVRAQVALEVLVLVVRGLQ